MKEKTNDKYYDNILLNSRVELLQKGGDPAAPSGTATLLRLSPSYLFYPNWLL